MSANTRQFIESLRRITNTNNSDIASFVYCTVKSVDKDERTCICVPINDKSIAEIPDVLLSSINNDGELKFPAIDSIVIVCRTAKSPPFVLKDSDLQEYLLIAEVILFNSDEFGGLVKVVDLTEKINRLENKLNDLLDKWNSFCTAYVPGSPSVTGLPATLATSILTVINPITQQSDIENTDIKHGSS